MKEDIAGLLNLIQSKNMNFSGLIAFIEERYDHTPTAFRNGEVYNEASQNQGSAKVLTFAKLNGLSEEDTLQLFAEHYEAVLATPEGTDHQNIRQFMARGWEGVAFEGVALKAKS
ncbi:MULTISPECIES: HopJ type III effector protein [Pedobacter]|uniref:HopJ type III effector protein n=1 Tax=Pedobacter TaxID=84567 RepID=UPI00210A3E30|nr:MULTISPECIES: HopJ type III effector protein [unclassified Pedobacter]